MSKLEIDMGNVKITLTVEGNVYPKIQPPIENIVVRKPSLPTAKNYKGRGRPNKFSETKFETIAQHLAAGENVAALSRRFKVHYTTMKKYVSKIKEQNVQKIKEEPKKTKAAGKKTA